jgi:hypothetical protein
MHESGNTARRLDLVDDPIPVPNRLHRYRRTWLAARQKLLERSAFVLDSFLPYDLAVGPCDRRECLVLVLERPELLARLSGTWPGVSEQQRGQ